MGYRDFVGSKDKQYVTEIHIADIHFGAGNIAPATQFEILQQQFLNVIAPIDFNILSIDGDLFDRRFMADHDAVRYAIEFVNACAEICRAKMATFVILQGTKSHDADQLKLFSAYQDPNDPLDFRIIDKTCFQYIQGLKVLCIPEEYNMGEEFYRHFLDEEYDTVFMHGTNVGSVYGANQEDLNSSKYPVFSIDSFAGCHGPIICGHVHKAMCLNKYIYYVSNPIRYRFGEEDEKGFCIVLHNRFSNHHLLKFIPIESFKFITLDIDSLTYGDPKFLIDYLNNVLENECDFIRLDFSKVNDQVLQRIIEQHYINNPQVSIKRYNEKDDNPKINTTEVIKDKYAGLNFLLDPHTDQLTKFVQFVNYNMGSQYITIERLKKLLENGGRPYATNPKENSYF